MIFQKDVRQLEANLRETLIEDDPFVRLFRHFMRVAHPNAEAAEWVRPSECSRGIESAIRNLHEIMVSGVAKRNRGAQSFGAVFHFIDSVVPRVKAMANQCMK